MIGTTAPIVKLETCRAIREYMFGGSAKITVVSNKTNLDLVFKIKDAGKNRFWVYVRYEATPKQKKRKSDKPYKKEYKGKYIGTIINNKWFPNAATLHYVSQRAFAWLWSFLKDHRMPTKCIIYHKGTCRRCEADLTSPKSILKGIGPCCEKLVKERLL